MRAELESLKEENKTLKQRIQDRDCILNQILDAIDEIRVCRNFSSDKKTKLTYIRTQTVFVFLSNSLPSRTAHTYQTGRDRQRQAHSIFVNTALHL